VAVPAETPAAGVEVVVVEVVADDTDGDSAEGREDVVVAVDVEEEEDAFRLCGWRSEDPAAGPDAVLDGAVLEWAELLVRVRTLPLGEDVLWELWTL